jgi:hypothetical protein
LPILLIAATIHLGGTVSLQEMIDVRLTRSNPMRVGASFAWRMMIRGQLSGERVAFEYGRVPLAA